LVTLVAGAPFSWEVPELQRFNIRGGWVVIPELVSIVVALSVYTAAFIGETVRSGIQSVSHGQTEAAASLGLRPGQV
ncbi:MAG TPA: amino acid ABC transporter permease, partial [Pseudomonas sp.]|nr:amino acid ABC transporter permease [Pseudomonas sp.]